MKLSEKIHEYTLRKLESWSGWTHITYIKRGLRIVDAIGDLELSEIKPKHYDYIKKYHASTSNDRNIFAIQQFLFRLLQDAYENDEIAKPPAKPAKLRHAPANEIKEYLDQDQIDLVISKIPVKDQAIFRFMQYSGCRPGEALALAWDDIHWNLNLVSITCNWTRTGIGDTKTHMPRNLPITPKLSRIFTHRENTYRLDEKPNLPKLSVDSHMRETLVFRYDSHLDRIWRQAARASGIAANLYVLRHSYATLLINKGVPIPVVSKLLGHSNIQTTLKFYVGVTRATEKESHEQLKRMFD
jgi:integrase